MSDLNDPRVFFAAERTLLAWNQASLALMAFGFVIERVGMLINVLSAPEAALPERGGSFWIGVAFILLGSVASTISVIQYRTVLGTLRPVEIPDGYRIYTGVSINLAIAALGIGLIVYLLL